ncbi:MAG: pilus (MSHA type) biogenesis protein MshL [Magnetococcales bacterium]|nr:pilus (MSHA type) biogenesis protein MshL [Magnetococcales bacterium]MBF0321460.1 pilus (MSHA type) biogenesis protein MshL [Magnetococcales bacterium]
MNKLQVVCGVFACSVLLFGCQNMPKPEDSQGVASPLQKSNQEMAERDQGLRRGEAELFQDLRHLYSGAPNRDVHGTLLRESEALTSRQQELHRDLAKKVSSPPELQPVLPEYNPLDDIVVSLEMDKEDVRHIFQALAKMTNMNLLINPEILKDPPYVSVSFRNVEASTVFREVLDLADLYGRIDDNVLRVDPHQEATYNVDFLETDTTSTFSAGGDVMGESGGGDAKSKGITGSYSVTGKSGDTNPYSQLDGILKSAIGEGGTYNLNRMSGLLHVKARPSAVRRTAKLLEEFKEIVGRQILIEARIMEVRLNDQHQTGVDWLALRNGILINRGIGQTLTPPLLSNPQVSFSSLPNLVTSTSAAVAGASGMALTIGRNVGKTSLLAALNMLKQYGDVHTVSNPSIRARHGQPAMISVGQSQAFVKQTKTTTNQLNGANTSTVDVTVDNVFQGLVIGIVPFINSQGKITLSIHPVKSDVDLSNSPAMGDTVITLPKVDLKEMSTSLQLDNDDTVILGGLINKTRSSVRTGVPVISEIPLLGRLFTSNSDSDVVSELVIMLRVNVL